MVKNIPSLVVRIIILLISAFLLFGFQVNAATYYSRQDGGYNEATTWSATSHSGSAVASPPCSCTPCHVGGSNVIEIAHDLTIGCNLTYAGNPTVTVLNGASLTVSGNASVSGSVVLVIDSGATINITGNFSVNGGGGSVTINGNLNIGGNFSINGGFPVCGTGSISIGGSVTGTPCVTLALPVTWLDISVFENKESVLVNWKTASEINNDYFTVQRSTDGIEFMPIGRIEGAGNSTSVKEYTFSDINPSQGLNYYRISQTDFDGTTDFSRTFPVFYSGKESKVAVVMPDNSSGAINVIFNDLKNSNAEISLYDLHGKLLKRESLSLKSENVLAELLPPPNLVQNLCLLIVRTESIFYSKKIVVSN